MIPPGLVSFIRARLAEDQVDPENAPAVDAKLRLVEGYRRAADAYDHPLADDSDAVRLVVWEQVMRSVGIEWNGHADYQLGWLP